MFESVEKYTEVFEMQNDYAQEVEELTESGSCSEGMFVSCLKVRVFRAWEEKVT